MAATGGTGDIVFIVDDEADVRDSLARLLRSEGLAVETFGSAQDFLDQSPEDRIGCLVLDVHMPGLSGPELHDQLIERGLLLPVIYLTGRSNIATGVRAMKQGAQDFLEKPVDADDLLAVVRQAAPEGPLALAGFSFGAFVTSHALARLWSERALERAVLVGTAASRFTVAPVPPEAHLRTLVVHGEADDTVPLAAVMDWARPQQLPVTVVPGGGHFFHGQLPLLKNLVMRHLQAAC